MDDGVQDVGGRRVLVCSAVGPPLAGRNAATGLISLAWEHQATVVAVPVARLPDAFFNLRSGLAGEILQTFVTYGLKIAIVGDVAEPMAASDALRDFITESNRGSAVWFVGDLQELSDR